MSERPGLTVRPAQPSDLSFVVDLSLTGRTDVSDVESGLQHLSVFQAAGGRIFVADDDGICGFLLARVVEPHLFSSTRAIIIDALFVEPPARRHGVGHALLALVAGLADELDVPYIYAAPPTHPDRGIQRFFARLGFAPVAGHRVVATPTLLRRLGEEAPVASSQELRARLGSRNALDELIARRRRARSGGLPTGPLDLRAVRGPGA